VERIANEGDKRFSALFVPQQGNPTQRAAIMRAIYGGGAHYSLDLEFVT
jgi:hypothetical protein